MLSRFSTHYVPFFDLGKDMTIVFIHNDPQIQTADAGSDPREGSFIIPHGLATPASYLL